MCVVLYQKVGAMRPGLCQPLPLSMGHRYAVCYRQLVDGIAPEYLCLIDDFSRLPGIVRPLLSLLECRSTKDSRLPPFDNRRLRDPVQATPGIRRGRNLQRFRPEWTQAPPARAPEF